MKQKNIRLSLFLSAVMIAFTTLFSLLESNVSAVSAKHLPSASAKFSLNLEDEELEIFGLINQERRKKGLSELYWDSDLAKMARNYSKKMARENFFDHYDADGESVIERAKKAKIGGWSKIGENLFFAESLSNYTGFAVKGWMRSPTHRANILDRAWTDSGIGIAKTRDGKIYVTHVFVKR